MQSRNSLFVAVVFKSVKPFYTARNYSYIWAYKLFMCVPMHMEYIHTLICDIAPLPSLLSVEWSTVSLERRKMIFPVWSICCINFQHDRGAFISPKASAAPKTPSYCSGEWYRLEPNYLVWIPALPFAGLQRRLWECTPQTPTRNLVVQGPQLLCWEIHHYFSAQKWLLS